MVAGDVKFDHLLLADLPLGQWFQLVEEKAFGHLHLEKYLSIIQEVDSSKKLHTNSLIEVDLNPNKFPTVAMMDTPATVNVKVDSTSKDLSIDIVEVASTNKKSATDPLSGDITHSTTNLQLDPTTKKVPKVIVRRLVTCSFSATLYITTQYI